MYVVRGTTYILALQSEHSFGLLVLHIKDLDGLLYLRSKNLRLSGLHMYALLYFVSDFFLPC